MINSKVGYFVAAIALLSGIQSATHQLNCKDLCEVNIEDLSESQVEECLPQNNKIHNFSRCVESLNEILKHANELTSEFLKSANASYGEEAIKANLEFLGALKYEMKTGKLNELYCKTKRRTMKLMLLVNIKKRFDEVPHKYLNVNVNDSVYPDLSTKYKLRIITLLKQNKIDVQKSIACNYTYSIDNTSWVKQLHNEDYDVLINIIEVEIETSVLLKVVQPTLSAGMFILCGCLNVLLLFIFVRCPESRAPRNMILLQLAVGDMLSLTVNLPIFHALVFLKLFPDDKAPYRFFEFVRYMCFSISIFSVVALCFQRYCATLKLTNRGMILRQSTKYSSTLVISTVWLCSIAMSVYHAFLCLHEECYKNLGDKKYVHNLSYAFDFLFLACLPLLLITTLSMLTVSHFKKRLAQLKLSLPPESWEESRKSLARSTTVLRLTPVVFGISFVPFYLLNVLRAWPGVNGKSVWFHWCYVITYFLIFVQTCFNPISIYATSSTFRGYFHAYNISCKKYGHRKTYRFDLQPEHCVKVNGRHSITEETEEQIFALKAEQH